MRGLAAGVYHYLADRHALERLRGPISAERLRSYYPSSGYFAEAPAHLLMTAVFARQLWRYPYARALGLPWPRRVTSARRFCLTATWMGLASFCLMGLADTRIEQDLGIDGITESVPYAAGVGHRPKGTAWAPSFATRVKPELMEG